MLTSKTAQKTPNIHFPHTVAISSLNIKTKLYLLCYAFIENENFHAGSNFQN